MKVWVERQVEIGPFSNASDYISDLIRKDREQKEAIAALQAAITEGAESGAPQSFDVITFKLRMREKHIAR